MESDRRPRRLLIALAVPAYAAGVAFLCLAVYLLIKGMQPGASQADWRPVSVGRRHVGGRPANAPTGRLWRTIDSKRTAGLHLMPVDGGWRCA